jgi:hypothetical protein
MTFLLATNKKNIKKNALFLAAYLEISAPPLGGGAEEVDVFALTAFLCGNFPPPPHANEVLIL